MARFFGVVGYGESVEDPPGSGNWSDVMNEFDYQGDIVRNTRQNESGDKQNDDITVQNSVSIVADDYAVKNFRNIKYVSESGALWSVTSVEIRVPRLILSLGKVYNGPTP